MSARERVRWVEGRGRREEGGAIGSMRWAAFPSSRSSRCSPSDALRRLRRGGLHRRSSVTGRSRPSLRSATLERGHVRRYEVRGDPRTSRRPRSHRRTREATALEASSAAQGQTCAGNQAEPTEGEASVAGLREVIRPRSCARHPERRAAEPRDLGSTARRRAGGLRPSAPSRPMSPLHTGGVQDGRARLRLAEDLELERVRDQAEVRP